MKYYSCDELNKIPRFIDYVNKHSMILSEYHTKLLNNIF
jgi:hypothetical protein